MWVPTPNTGEYREETVWPSRCSQPISGRRKYRSVYTFWGFEKQSRNVWFIHTVFIYTVQCIVLIITVIYVNFRKYTKKWMIEGRLCCFMKIETMASWSSKSKIISLCCIKDTSSFAISRYEQGTLGQVHALLSGEVLHRKENIRNVV